MLSETDSVIKIGARYTHVLNEMSAISVIEQERLSVYDLFIYNPREYI